MPLPAELRNNWPEIVEKYDGIHRRVKGYQGRAYGAFFRDEMAKLCQARQDGRMDALERWVVKFMHDFPNLFSDCVRA